ncbi:MAG: hypothetical protein FJX74_20050 [Armatimonadetes bacterium]|nr:hypothetical protein [Armatimonadota bacterium]
MRYLLLSAVLVACPATGALPQAAVLFADPSGPDTLALRVLLIHQGPAPEDVEYVLSLAPPGGTARTLSAAVPASGWTADGLRLVAFEPLTVGPEAGDLVITGGLPGAPTERLATLIRGEGGRLELRRVPPGGGPDRLFAVASAEQLGPRRFTVKVAYINCGERLSRDYDAFLHFEPEPTGEDLAATTEMGLYPSGKPTDSSAWHEDDITVVAFGPYELPAKLDRPLYVRVGLYDRTGDGARRPLLGAAEDHRVLVGRFAPRDGAVVFERAPFEEAKQ